MKTLVAVLLAIACRSFRFALGDSKQPRESSDCDSLRAHLLVGQCESAHLEAKRRGKLTAKHDVSGCIFSVYVKWLRAERHSRRGASVGYPLCHSWTRSCPKVNGILLPGGWVE